jgi:hypothetical protein
MLGSMQSTGIHEGQPASDGRHEPAAPIPAGTPRYYSVKATAALLDVGRLFVYRRFHAGVFPGRKAGRKIDIFGPFVDALVAEINSGRAVDVEAFAASWPASWVAVA